MSTLGYESNLNSLAQIAGQAPVNAVEYGLQGGKRSKKRASAKKKTRPKPKSKSCCNCNCDSKSKSKSKSCCNCNCDSKLMKQVAELLKKNIHVMRHKSRPDARAKKTKHSRGRKNRGTRKKTSRR